ncbi:MAG: TMEM175 family protein [Dehalococcoidia bacterium]
MIRQKMIEQKIGVKPDTVMRGGDVSRLEGLTDAVFGFAITLLVVSLDVPDNFDELQRELLHFPAFVACFALLLVFWRAHYDYFRRFGLEDGFVITVNSALLFVILFFVYPLKFLFSWTIDGLLGLPTDVMRPDGVATPAIEPQDIPLLMTFYGTGMVLIAVCFVLLYLHALRLGGVLNLTTRERIEAEGDLAECVAYIGIATLSIVLAWVFQSGTLSGLTYLLYPVAGGFFGRRTEARVRRASKT